MDNAINIKSVYTTPLQLCNEVFMDFLELSSRKDEQEMLYSMVTEYLISTKPYHDCWNEPIDYKKLLLALTRVAICFNAKPEYQRHAIIKGISKKTYFESSSLCREDRRRADHFLSKRTMEHYAWRREFLNATNARFINLQYNNLLKLTLNGNFFASMQIQNE